MLLKKNTELKGAIKVLGVIVLLSIFCVGSAWSYPTTPTNLSASTGNFWVNWTWDKEDGTDSFNVSWNSTWHNGTTNTYMNDSVGIHQWANISVFAFNLTTGNLSVTSIDGQQQVPNNVVLLTVTQVYTELEGKMIFISDTSSSDADGDTPTYSCNRTDLFTDFSTSTGYGNWTTGTTDSGVYYVDVGVSDGYGSEDNKTLTITIIDATPGIPINIVNVSGNFYINHTWNSGINTNSFNVTVNDTWYNGSTNTSYNNTLLSPHSWSNISIYGYNSTLDELSLPLSQNTQIPNNPPTITNCNDWSGIVGDVMGDIVELDFGYIDLDGDVCTFFTNAIFGNLNINTGVFEWQTGAGDDGVYYWQFNVSDDYGSTGNCTVTILLSRFGTLEEFIDTLGVSFTLLGILAIVSLASLILVVLFAMKSGMEINYTTILIGFVMLIGLFILLYIMLPLFDAIIDAMGR